MTEASLSLGLRDEISETEASRHPSWEQPWIEGSSSWPSRSSVGHGLCARWGGRCLGTQCQELRAGLGGSKHFVSFWGRGAITRDFFSLYF